MDFSEWQQTAVNPLAVKLDDENPRLAAKGLAQPEIRRLLLEHEDVAKLTHSIVRAGGVYPHDLLIVGYENDELTVFEGNRRIAALQMLLDPSLIPTEFRDKVARATEELKKAIYDLPAVMAPDRSAADHVIAQIHAFSARKGWSPLAKYRYAYTRYDEGQSVGEIAIDLGSDAAEVRKFIRRYNIYRYMLELDWDQAELDILRGDDVSVTPFLYPFERSAIKDMVGEVFDSEGRPNPAYRKDVRDRFVKRLARDALIPQALTGKPTLSTRGTASGSIDGYFSESHKEIIAERGRIEEASKKPPPPPPPPPAPPAPPPPPKPPRPDTFFESFTVPRTLDQRIIALAGEIARIDYRRFPIAAGMLLRALLEEVLREHLKRRSLYDKYKRGLGPKGKEGLKSMVLYASNKANGTFKDEKVSEQLARFQNSAVKDDLDNIVHSRFGVMNKEGLIAIKPWVRPIIEIIITEEWA